MLPVSGAPRQGFSLMEILIAVAILGVLATFLVPKFTGLLGGARVDTAKQQLRQLKSSIDGFYLRHTDYPDSLKDFVRKPTNPELAKNWIEATYEDKQLVDPWKQKFQYTKTPGQTHPYELYSYGPKGKSTPKNERINVWDL